MVQRRDDQPSSLLACDVADTGLTAGRVNGVRAFKLRSDGLELERRTGIADNDCPRGSRFSIGVGWRGHSCQDLVLAGSEGVSAFGVFRGRPPFLPFALAAFVLALLFALPPFAPISARY